MKVTINGAGRFLIHQLTAAGKWWRGLRRWHRVLISLLVIFMAVVLCMPLPSPVFDDPSSTTLRANDGTLLSAAIAADGQWRFPASDSIPRKFRTCIRLFEDEYFYDHPGVNPVALVRAAYTDLKAGRIVSGGSTLSMQTIRLAYRNPPRTFLNKLVEILATFKLELFYSKRNILKMYADHCPYGGNIVGLNAASWRYYGRPPEKLSWAESASLAILPNNPGAVFPGKNQEQFLQKRNRLLDKLHARGFLSVEDVYLSKQEPLPSQVRPLPNLAYHLLHRSMQEGHTGENIVSTIDFNLQAEANRRVNDYSARMAANEIHNAAAIVLDIETGNTLAYVGNTDNPGDNGQAVDVITSLRSPGSLLKPILYAASLDEGLILPKQLLPDIPVFYKGFSPKNFDKTYRGAVPADQALSSSLNVPFVHLLIDYGYEKFNQKLKDMGMTSLTQPAGHYGLSIILGGAETSLWELSALYAGMARAYYHYGKRPYRHGYSPQDYHPDRYLATQEPKEHLSDDGYLRVPSLGYAFRAMQQLHRPDEETGWQFFGSSRPIAWKTGTSYGFRDGWAIGINNQYLVGVWLGNADGEGRPGLTGVSAAAPLMFNLFDLLGGDASFEQQYGSPVDVCAESGMLASPNCRDKLSMNLPDYMLSTPECSYHQLIHLDHEGKHQVNSSCYDVAKMQTVPWFVLPPVEAWYYSRRHPAYSSLPPYLASCSAPDKRKLFALIYPGQYARVHIPVEQDGRPGRVVFEATHEDPDATIYWHLDDQYLGATQHRHQMAVSTLAGKHVLTLVDNQGNELSQAFEVVN